MCATSKLFSICFLAFFQCFLLANSYATVASKPSPVKSNASSLTFVETAYPYDMSAGDTQNFVYVIQNKGTAETKLTINGYLPPIVRDPNVPNNCGDTLQPGKMCYIKLTTTPTDEMAFKQVLNINNGELTAPLNFAVHALKIIYKDTIDLVNSYPDRNTEGKITIQNTAKSSQLMNLTANPDVPFGTKFTITGTTCPTVLVPGQICAYNYVYTAPKAADIKSDVVNINVGFNFNYYVNADKATLSLPIQLSQFNYWHFMTLPANITGFKDLPCKWINTISSVGDSIYVGSYNGISISKDGGLSWKNITTAQGLAGNWVKRIKVTPEQNKIFVATYKGLSMSSDGGNSWKNTTFVPGLGCDTVYTNSDGTRIYVGLWWWGGLFVSEDEGITWKHYTSELASTWVNAVYASNDGKRIYAGTKGGLSISIDGGLSWKTYTKADSGLVDDNILGIFASDDGVRIYVATNSGLSISFDSGKNWKNFNVGGRSIYVSNDGARIYTSSDKGVDISSDGGITWKSYELSSLNCSDVYASQDGRKIFVATDNGVAISLDSGATWKKYFSLKLPNASWVSGVHANHDGSKIYIATSCCGYAGVSMSTDSGATWSSVSGREGLGAASANKIFANEQGDKIYVSLDGLPRMKWGGISISKDNGVTWKVSNPEQGLGSYNATSIHVSQDESTVIAGTDNGVSISTDGGTTWKNKTTSDGLGSNKVKHIYANQTGAKVLAATENGLGISNDFGSTWTNITKQQGLADDWIFAVFLTREGNKIFAGTNHGLSMSKDDGITWENYTVNSVRVVRSNEDGSKIYLGGDGLITSLDGGVSWKTYTIQQGLGNNDVNDLYVTPDGLKIFAATSNGGLSYTLTGPAETQKNK